MRRRDEIVLAVLVLLVAFVVMSVIAWQGVKCADREGVLVRGAIWFKCVAGAP